MRGTQATLGSEITGIGVTIPDAQGRLRRAAGLGNPPGTSRPRSAKRRGSFRSMRMELWDLPPSGPAVGFFPLVSTGQPYGVLEIEAPRPALERSVRVLEALASQAGGVLRNVRERERLARDAETLRWSSEVLQDLIRALTPEEAVGAAVRYCHERLEAPVAAWMAQAPGEPMILSAKRGLSRQGARDLQVKMEVLPREADSARSGREASARFASIAGQQECHFVDCDHAILVAAVSEDELGRALGPVGPLLHTVLDHLFVVAQAHRRNEHLDRGLAWTAHEVRSPLVNAKAIIEQLVASSGGEQRILMFRAQRQLSKLLGDVDGLLTWAVGKGALQLKETGILRVLYDAVSASGVESASSRVRIRASGDIVILADEPHLRSAVANVIRNALLYSDPSEPVTVTVERHDDRVRMRVRDQGQAIAPDDREGIFDPFVRGRSGRARAGSGLGLFISRRVIEAHEGSIWLEPTSEGTSMMIELLAAPEVALRWTRSRAS